MIVSVCVSVRLHISKTTQLSFAKFSAHAQRGLRSVLLWRWYDTLRISGFVDDVMFSHDRQYRASCVFQSLDYRIESNQILLNDKKSVPWDWAVGRGAKSAVYDCLVLCAQTNWTLVERIDLPVNVERARHHTQRTDALVALSLIHISEPTRPY